jgi:hypothetical protein
MLEQRGLTASDKRPLYRYRLSEDEFDALGVLLRAHAGQDMHQIKHKPGFCACWFLFAAEWWKRSYAGGAWSWAPIFATLGMDDQAQGLRSEWVEEASRYWQLEDQLLRGKRFLGRVVANGGLPLALIADAGSGVFRLLNMVQQDMARTGALTEAQVIAELCARSGMIPECYRQQHVFNLLADVLLTIQRLNAEIGKDGGKDPVEKLDQSHPGWLDEFPLQLEPTHARNLLGGLVRHAFEATNKLYLPFQIIRQMRFDATGRPTKLESMFETVTRIKGVELARLLGKQDDEAGTLPASMEMTLGIDKQTLPVGRLLRRDGEYLVHAEVTTLPAKWFGQDIWLEISRFGQILGRPELPGGDVPEPDMPWIFEDNIPACRLIGTGSVKLRDASCLISCEPSALLFGDDEDLTELNGLDGRCVSRSTATNLPISIGREHYQVTCRDVSAREQGLLVWTGKRVTMPAGQPVHVFSGFPDAFETFASGDRRKVPRSDLYWQSKPGEKLPIEAAISRHAARPNGMGSLIWMRNNKILRRIHAVCLPETASIEILPDPDGSGDGCIKLHDWQAVSLRVDSPGVHVVPKPVNNSWILSCRKTGPTPPLQLNVSLTWPNGKVQHITLPYPAIGAFTYRTDNPERLTTTQFSTSDLLGLRVRLQGNPGLHWEVKLQLQNSGGGAEDFRIIDCPSSVENGIIDLRLFELQQAILQMLATVDEIDAKVRIDFIYGGRVFHHLIIHRYGGQLVPNTLEGLVMLEQHGQQRDVETLRAMCLQAVPILEPDTRPITLHAINSEGVPTGTWHFDEKHLTPGTWLIYPSADTPGVCRPIAWQVRERFAGPDKTYQGLRAAIQIRYRPERLEALTRAFEAIALRPDASDWRLVQLYAEKLGHLPLSSLDIWVALTRSPRAMIMALLHIEGFSEQIAPRLCQELPFEWLLTSPQDWLFVIQALRTALPKECTLELRLLKFDLETKLEWLRRLYPSLELSVALALSRGLGLKQTPDIELLLNAPDSIRTFWLQRLFSGETSDVQGMMQRAGQILESKENNILPKTLRTLCTKFSATPTGQRLLQGLKLPRDDDKFSLAVVPLAFAYDVAGGQSSQWFMDHGRLAAMRTYRSFDMHWFDEAYKVALVCAFDDGLITV